MSGVLGVRGRLGRYLVGFAISLLFIALTLSRVDIHEVAWALSQVALAGLALALVLTVGEVSTRAYRWQRLLLPIRDVPYPAALGQLCVGYFANSILPARLGDVVRAFLAADRFGLARMVTFGSILIERIGDGFTILLIVTALILALPEAQPLAAIAIPVAAFGFLAVAGAATILLVTHHTRVATTGIGRLVRVVTVRLEPALAGLRTPFRFGRFVGLTLVAFAIGVTTFTVVCAALGLRVTPLQAALVTGGLALSTAIPAAPGSIGTYEFVGVAIMAGLGFPAEESLAAVLLTHLVAVLPPAVAGLAVVWHDHIRIGAIVEEAAHADEGASAVLTSVAARPAPSVAILMPAYNEAERIERTIDRVARYRSERGLEWPVVLADDGSTDATVARARAAAAAAGLPLEVLSFPHRGKAASVRDGMLALAGTARADYLMMLDADDEVRIDDLDNAAWQAGDSTIYIARRIGAAPGSAARPSVFRRAMSGGMRLASRTLLGLDFPDTQCGFKLFPRRFAAAIFAQQRSTGWVFDAELLVIAYKVSGLPVHELPVTWQPRGGSKVARTAALTSAAGLLGIAWRYWSGVYEPVVDREVAVAKEAARA